MVHVVIEGMFLLAGSWGCRDMLPLNILEQVIFITLFSGSIIYCFPDSLMPYNDKGKWINEKHCSSNITVPFLSTRCYHVLLGAKHIYSFYEHQCSSYKY
jgi:hypothetical protein